MNILTKNKFKTLLLTVFIFLMSIGCSNDEIVTFQKGGIQGITDPYVKISTPVISFQAGTRKYGISFNATSSQKKITRVDVYSIFKDAEATTGKSSNEVLLKSYDVTSDLKQVITDSLTYEELRKDIKLGENLLPDFDVDLSVGAGWVLRLEGVTSKGEFDAGKINISVLSRFAGQYRVVTSNYFRIGEESDNWTGEERFIGSIDDTTFSYNDFWAGFEWSGKSFRFTIDFSDNSITVPILVNDEIFSGNRAINCIDDAASFTNVSCTGSNILIPNDATGIHRIMLTYGYSSDNGFREFSEVLEKIVN